MKLFSWANKKLLFTHSPEKNQHNAGKFIQKSRQSLACVEEPIEVQAACHRSSSDTHVDVLTIGTLGIGSLLSHGYKEEEEEEDEEDEDEDDDDDDDEEQEDEIVVQSQITESLSLNRQSISSSCINRASVSSNRASVSSNRESVSSVDLQKLQEELQKILYSKPIEHHYEAPSSAINSKGGKATKAKKKGKSKDQQHRRGSVDADRKNKPHVPKSESGSARGLLPLRSYLEMPMDTLIFPCNASKEKGGPSLKFLNKKHYLLLLQSLKSRFLHSSAPTHVNIPPPLFDSLVKPNPKEGLSQQHATTMDKALRLLQKVTRRGSNGWGKWNTKEGKIRERLNACSEKDNEEESLKWAIARSNRGSERFMNYITNTLAQADKYDNLQQQDYYNDTNHQELEEGGHVQRRLSPSTSISSECWINTDDEYLVLEL